MVLVEFLLFLVVMVCFFVINDVVIFSNGILKSLDIKLNIEIEIFIVVNFVEFVILIK